MFKLISDVPAPIVEFYQEEVRREPTGNQIEEEYTYLDENEVEQTGTRLVDEYHDVVYVVELPRHDLKNWVFVEHVSDTKLDFKKYCIEKACEAERWDYHDAYLLWLSQKPQADDGKYSQKDVNDEPLHDYAADLAAWQALEPQAKFTDAQIVINALTQRVAKVTRDIGRYAPITVDGLTYDATQEAYDNLQGMVNSWDTLITDPTLIESGIVSEGQMYWTLADNTNVLVTKETLEAVVTAIRVRAGLLHAQYQAEKANEVTV